MGTPPSNYTRQELYQPIWQEPTRKVAERLGISDVGLAKVCRKYHIPRPWRGYWREKETGKRPRQPKLLPWPKHLGPEPGGITFHTAPAIPTAPGEPPPPRPPKPAAIETQAAHEAAEDHRLALHPELQDPYCLARHAARLLSRRPRATAIAGGLPLASTIPARHRPAALGHLCRRGVGAGGAISGLRWALQRQEHSFQSPAGGRWPRHPGDRVSSLGP